MKTISIAKALVFILLSWGIAAPEEMRVDELHLGMSRKTADLIQEKLGRQPHVLEGKVWYFEGRSVIECLNIGPEVWFDRNDQICRIEGFFLQFAGGNFSHGEPVRKVIALIGEPDSREQVSDGVVRLSFFQHQLEISVRSEDATIISFEMVGTEL